MSVVKTIREMPHEDLEREVKTCVGNVCLLINAYVDSDGKAGWSAGVKNADGHTLLSKREQGTIEQAFSVSWVLPFLKGEKIAVGGDEHETKVFQSAKKTAHMESFWNEFEQRDQGFTRISNSSISGKPLADFLVGLAETGDKTIHILLEELVNGEWRNAILVGVTLLTKSGAAASVLFNNIIHLWLFAAPSEKPRVVKKVSAGDNHGVFNDAAGHTFAAFGCEKDFTGIRRGEHDPIMLFQFDPAELRVDRAHLILYFAERIGIGKAF